VIVSAIVYAVYIGFYFSQLRRKKTGRET
jgi:hypothetical protein